MVWSIQSAGALDYFNINYLYTIYVYNIKYKLI